MGINVEPAFMDMACIFLNCSQGCFPFKYFGLSVGGNPSQISTWDPLLDQFSKRLPSWGNRYLSLGGRIVLLNPVLNVILIFYLSFFKMPVSVASKIVRIQREFLWGGTEGGRKISLVSWKVVCQPKEFGGLGVRDVRLVNLCLLAKWRWRLLYGGNALWREVLIERYGIKVGELMGGGVGLWPTNALRRWKDLVSITKGEEVDWFNEEVVRRVGNGLCASFWREAWRGNEPFMLKYERLFSISSNQEANVHDLWIPNSSGGGWAFNWRCPLFVWEKNLLTELLGDLEGFEFSIEDGLWMWRLQDDNIFSVKSMYLKLEGRENGVVGNSEGERRVFRQIWKSVAPSKVSAFVWKALLDCFPTRMNLEIRNCLPIGIGLNCVWCEGIPESTSHLLLHCDMAWNIWLNLMKWLDLNFVMPPNLFIHWECWSGGPLHKKIRKGLRLIWEVAIWVIWKARNGRIFNDEMALWDELVEEVKVMSWRCVLGRFDIPACLFYEWCWCPRDCLMR